jgi:hypothetical protein
MLEQLKTYLLIVSTSIYLLYSYIMFVSEDKVVNGMYDADNKVSYIWNKKTRFALLLDEFSNTNDCIKSYNYLNNLINGSDLNLNPGQ